MGIVKSYPVTKIINGLTIKTSDSITCTSSFYKTNGESTIVVTGVDSCTITLDETTTDHITIKAMCDVKITSDKKIDEEFDEIVLERYASVELKYVINCWYILSSDGIKNS